MKVRWSPATLRGRMLALGLGIAALVIVAVAVPVALLTRAAVTQEAHRDATTAAQTAADFLSHGTSPDARVLDEYLARLARRTGVAVSVIQSSSGPVAGSPLSRREREEVAERPPIGVDSDHDRDDLRGVFVGPDVVIPGGRLIQVYVPEPQGVSRVLARTDDRAVAVRVWRQYGWLALAALILFALAGAAAELTSRRLARPLQDVAETARALQGGDRTARARLDGPKEVADVASELNALADRIDELLVQERETVADLSHSLRTPLTAVRLSAEMLPDSPAKTELEAHVARLERTLSSVIASARRPLREGVHGRADAVAVVADRVAFWRPLAEDQGRAMHEDICGGPQWVRLSAADLATALDALLENVFAHTAEGTAVAVHLAAEESSVVLDVLDDGSGVPPSAVERGRSRGTSSGLGLDIARATAVASGGALELLRGARSGVRLRLGLAG